MLFGTDEPVEPPRLLTAGPLTAELEAGNLRYIRYDGIEMIRAVSFIVRDQNWGTYDPAISNLDVERERRTASRSPMMPATTDEAQEFRYSATITGACRRASSISSAKGEAVTDFLTNRTGFVVLHPIAGVAGAPARSRRSTASSSRRSFPELIDPVSR